MKKYSPVFGVLFVCFAISAIFADIGAPSYVPNPANAASGAAMGGDVTGTVAANTVISATTAGLTAGGITTTNNAVVRRVWTRYDWTNAQVAALGATTAGDLTVCTLPAKTLVHRCIIVLQTSGGTVTTLTVAVGRTSATYIDYVTANDAKAAANTMYGDTKDEIGTHLYDGVTIIDDLPSYTATTAIKAHFISTGANLSAVTTTTGAIYIESSVLP